MSPLLSSPLSIFHTVLRQSLPIFCPLYLLFPPPPSPPCYFALDGPTSDSNLEICAFYRNKRRAVIFQRETIDLDLLLFWYSIFYTFFFQFLFFAFCYFNYLETHLFLLLILYKYLKPLFFFSLMKRPCFLSPYFHVVIIGHSFAKRFEFYCKTGFSMWLLFFLFFVTEQRFKEYLLIMYVSDFFCPSTFLGLYIS